MTLTAQELRIGNVIKDDRKAKEWRYVTHRIIADMASNPNIELYHPVPITEEWLETLGWLWNSECNSYEGDDARMYLQYRDVSGSYTMFNYILKATIAERIYYVHQLQNLYFALKGKELSI